MMAAAHHLRPLQAIPIPSEELRNRDNIRFLHPGYGAPQNLLLLLPRVDIGSGGTSNTSESDVYGVHHGTALTACQIIADNAFETGYLTIDERGEQVVDIPLDSVLTRDVYFFFVGGSPGQYPVVPNFNNWVFPHDRIPEYWRNASLTLPSTEPQPTGRCSVSNFSLPTEAAHLVPQKERQWYSRNGMRRYGDGLVRDIDTDSNLLALRSDIHRVFDERMFAIIPKNSQYATHILDRKAANFWPTYHNTPAQYLHHDSRPYLFARFAWAILLRVKGFICSGDKRSVIQIGTPSEGGILHKTEVLSGSQLMSLYDGGESKDARPLKKRGFSEVDGESSLMESDSSEAEDGGWNDRNFWGSNHRRRHQQHSSDETAPDAEIKPVLAPSVEANLRAAAMQISR